VTYTVNSDTYWLDGSDSTYRNYDYNEPNDDSKCFFIRADNHGNFEDGYCTSSQKYYICKITSGSLYSYTRIAPRSLFCTMECSTMYCRQKLMSSTQVSGYNVRLSLYLRPQIDEVNFSVIQTNDVAHMLLLNDSRFY